MNKFVFTYYNDQKRPLDATKNKNKIKKLLTSQRMSMCIQPYTRAHIIITLHTEGDIFIAYVRAG